MGNPEFYLHIHKAIRRRLYLASILVGTTDFEDRHAVQILEAELQSLFTLLRRHAHHEDAHIHPLIRAVMPEMNLDEEHLEQDRVLGKMEEMLASMSNAEEKRELGLSLYREFNAFVAHSLEHMALEEGLMPLLLRKYSQEQLRKTSAAVIASFTPEEIAEIPKYFPQALNPQERMMFGLS